jgi:alpha,alpha-trehalose phosphorylase (configuration-retaining)
MGVRTKTIDQTLPQELSTLRINVERLDLPFPSYLGLTKKGNTVETCLLGSEGADIHTHNIKNIKSTQLFLDQAVEKAATPGSKIVALGLENSAYTLNSASDLWLEKDIVSLPFSKLRGARSEELAEQAASCFDDDQVIEVEVSEDQEVMVRDLTTLSAYENTCPQKDFTLLLNLAVQFKGKKLAFINATPQGGGVALMRHALIRLFRQLEVDVSWYVLKPKAEVFDVTKTKFHNVLQAAVDDEVRLTSKDKILYNSWIEENAQVFTPMFKQMDVIVIDDPQPSGLIPWIKKINPKAKIIYRSHIQVEAALVDTPGTSQHNTWKFLWESIEQADSFVSHPVLTFIPANVPREKITLMTATTDPVDGLNKPLTDSQINYYMKLFDRYLYEENQTPLDPTRPYLIQIARFDPSKGIPDVIASYAKLSDRLKKMSLPRPQLVLTGHGSIDDPDRIPIFTMIMELIHSEKYRHLSDDIKVAKLPHVDQLLNALMRKSLIALQLSTKEGFEVKVTEALMKGKPIVAYRTGGIPLQIQDGVSGYLVERGDIDKVSEHLFDLMVDKKLYRKMSKAALRYANKQYLTIHNAINWLSLSLKVLEKDQD